MERLLPFVEQYGYALLLSVGFVEFIGVPIAGTPFVVLAGALAARGALHPGLAIGSLVAGALVADGVWFALARWRGSRLVERVCGLTSHPGACVLGVTSRGARLGPWYVLAAKLLPGTGNLIAPAAGFARMRARTFLPLDAASLLLWAGAYLAVGWVFAPHVAVVVDWIGGVTRGAVVAAVLLVAAAAGWRMVKVRRHRAAHAAVAPALTSSGATTPAAAAVNV